jgi:hypothetical protein
VRDTYATALVNAGVSLQALMALLGHVSAEMSLRYGRLFDSPSAPTTNAPWNSLNSKPALQLPAGNSPAGRVQLPLADITGGKDWRTTLPLKSRMAAGFCLRTPRPGHLQLRQHLRTLPPATGRPLWAAMNAATATGPSRS